MVKVSGFWLGSAIPSIFPVQFSNIYPAAGMASRIILSTGSYFSFSGCTSTVPPLVELLTTVSD